MPSSFCDVCGEPLPLALMDRGRCGRCSCLPVAGGNPLLTPQPDPRPWAGDEDSEASWSGVVRWARARLGRLDEPAQDGRRHLYGLLIHDMIDRDAQGRAKYGVRLRPFNGRDTLADLFKEILDACAYSWTALAEAGGPDNPTNATAPLRDVFDRSFRLALDVRRLILARDGR